MAFDRTNDLNSIAEANNGDFSFTDRAGNTGDTVKASNTAGEWCEDNGSCGTVSSGTGPQDNCPPAPASDGFIYLETSSPAASTVWAMKRDSSFDATLVAVTIHLHYNGNTETTADIIIEYATVASPNETTDWTILETIDAAGTDTWIADTFDFSAIDSTTTLWIRVRCDTDANFTNDLAFANWREVGVDRGPTITDVDTDEIVDDNQTGVVVTGTDFGATDTGSADLELGDSSNHATANLISQTRTGWSATSITGVTIDLGTQSPGLKYFFVTDSTGTVGTGFAVTVHREHELRMIASANIAASGENTTAQLTAPAGKTTGDFDAGRIQDDENPADTVDITADNYTEMEWCFELKANAPDGQAYVFRITKNGVVIDTYTVTPQITVSTAVYTPLDRAHRPQHQPILAH